MTTGNGQRDTMLLTFTVEGEGTERGEEAASRSCKRYGARGSALESSKRNTTRLILGFS